MRVERGSAGADDATLLYLRALTVLEKAGISKPAWVTPGEFVRHMPNPASASALGALTGAYNELRFGARAEAASIIMRHLHDLEISLKTDSSGASDV